MGTLIYLKSIGQSIEQNKTKQNVSTAEYTLMLVQYIDNAIYRFINKCDTTSIFKLRISIMIQGQRLIISLAYLMS